MFKLGYYFAKIKSILKQDNEIVNQYYRSGGGKNWEKMSDLYPYSAAQR